MKYKGVEFLAGSVGGYVIYKVLDYFEPKLVDAVLTLNGVSLSLLADFVFILLTGFAVFLILKQKHGWFKKSSEQQEKSEKYDAKKLNNNIFRKLTRIEFTYKWDGYLTFRIPRDERAFAHRNSGTYASWMVESAVRDRESNFNQIENAIPDLNIGEKYLKLSYPMVYEKWQEIKKIVEEYNNRHKDFLNKLGVIFEKEFNPQFSDFMKSELEPKKIKKNFGGIYDLENIVELLYRAILNNSESQSCATFNQLKLEKGDNSSFVRNGRSGSILITGDEKKIDVEKIRKILINIANDGKTRSQFFEYRKRDLSEIDKLFAFRDKLEDEVVNDIDNQV